MAAALDGFIIERGFDDRDRAAVVALLRDYERDIGISLCFQDFEAELAGLPGAYGPPRGTMLFARDRRNRSMIGCVALRAFPGGEACEMKRLYIRSHARASGLGRMLALAIIEEARQFGYRRMCLDTLPSMTAAQALYRALGFRQVGTSGSAPEVLLFERELAA